MESAVVVETEGDDISKATVQCEGRDEVHRASCKSVEHEAFREERPMTAPAILECGDVSADNAAESALEMMTQEAITMFREGRQQEALDLVVQFSLTARAQLGRTHPVFINALATVAALVDQMGGSEQASALLLEAQDLQDEMDMEALGINLDADVDEDGEDDQWNDEMAMDELSTRPPTDLSEGRGRSTNRSVSRGSQHGTEQSEVYSDDEDWFGLHSDEDGSEGDADIEPCSDDNDKGFDEDDDGAEAEAEAITRLTWEVNTLLRHDSPEEAAKLLSESEQILVAGGGDVGPVCKAALHTLWSAVLHAVGENEKAQCLYDEAIHVLQTEVGPGFEDTGSTSEGNSTSGDEDLGKQQEDEEEEGEEEAKTSNTSDNGSCREEQVTSRNCEDLHQDEKQGSERCNEKNEECETPLELKSEDVPFFATEPDAQTSTQVAEFTATDIILASQRAARLRAEMGYPEKNESKDNSLHVDEDDVCTGAKLERLPPQKVADNNDTDPALVNSVSAYVSVGDCIGNTCVVDSSNTESSLQDLQPLDKQRDFEVSDSKAESHDNVTEATDSVVAPSIKVPTPPQGASPTKKRPPALAPQPSYRQAGAKPVAKPGAKAATRCGGGFAGMIQRPKGKAKAKAKPQTVSRESDDAPNPQEIAESTVPSSSTPEPEEPTVEAAALEENAPSPPQTAEQQKEAIERAMTCADHFLGLLKFEKAADKLEKQLSMLAEESCPHHHSALHVDVMEKYGGVLWWDGDPEGAIDAYTAAEEILIEKPRDDWQVKRRTDIWMQAAQICRGCGDLDSADEQLSQAIYCLTELVDKTEHKNSEYTDSLREAQAALGQVCVEKKEFERAEEFYLVAFGTDGMEDETKRLEDDETSERGSQVGSSQDR